MRAYRCGPIPLPYRGGNPIPRSTSKSPKSYCAAELSKLSERYAKSIFGGYTDRCKQKYGQKGQKFRFCGNWPPISCQLDGSSRSYFHWQVVSSHNGSCELTFAIAVAVTLKKYIRNPPVNRFWNRCVYVVSCIAEDNFFDSLLFELKRINAM